MTASSLFSAGGLIFFIILWSGASGIIDDTIILPGPRSVFTSFVQHAGSISFFTDLGITILRSLSGLSMSVILGVGTGLLMGLSSKIRPLLYPAITIIQSVPAISWLLIALIWFTPPMIPVFLVFFATYPIITLNTAEGIEETDRGLLEMAALYQVPRNKVITHIYFPEIRGYIQSAFRITTGFSFKTALMAEVLAHPGSGIGERLSWARLNIAMPELFMYTMTAVIITFLLTHILLKAELL